MTTDTDIYFENRKAVFAIATKLYRFDHSLMLKLKERKLKSPKETVAVSVISESHDYLKSCITAVRGSYLRSAGSLLRSLLESTANLDWIFADKSNKRAKRYIATIEILSEHMDGMLEKPQLPDQRIPQDLGEWTSSSAEDRIKAHSPLALIIWDYCSHFTHAKPSLIQYLLRSKSGKVPLFLAGQSLVYALTIRLLVAEYTDLIDNNERERLLSMVTELMPNLP